MATILSIFNEHCDRFQWTRERVRLVKDYRLAFFNRNQSHFNFFTGNLLGVHPIRFRDQDRRLWFEEILEVDEIDLKDALKTVESLDPSWHRANDVMNLSCIWLMHTCFQSQVLSQKQKDDGLTNVFLMLQYKFLSSVLTRYLPYPTDESIALATYEALSRKFQIKQYGSWQALLEARTRDVLHPSSIHYTAYTQMKPDTAVIAMINDVQQRIREIVKKYMALFLRMKEENLRIKPAGYQIEIDGELQILDQTRAHSDYTRYLKEIISDQDTFIRDELIEVILKAVNTAKVVHLRNTLVYCSNNFGPGGDVTIEKLIDELLYHAYAFITENEGAMASTSDLAGLMTRLKYLYSASRMSDPGLLRAKTYATKIVIKTLRTRNSATVASTRNAFQLYLVLRAFSRKYFRQ